MAFALPAAPVLAPTNTHFWLSTYRNWTLTDDPGYFDLYEFSLSSIPERGSPSDGPDVRALGQGGIEVVSTMAEVDGCSLGSGVTELRATEPLAPSTSYGYSGFTSGLDWYEGAFWTDGGEDRVVPVFAGIGDIVVEQIQCAFEDRVEDRIRVTASGEGEATDDRSVAAFRLYADDEVIAASFDSSIRAIVPALTEERCFSIRAVDLAGNVDENEAVACLGPEDVVQGPSYELQAPYDSWREVLPDDVPAGASGCRAVPGGSRGPARWGWLVLTLSLALGAGRARRPGSVPSGLARPPRRPHPG